MNTATRAPCSLAGPCDPRGPASTEPGWGATVVLLLIVGFLVVALARKKVRR
jgi:hypothetical protein